MEQSQDYKEDKNMFLSIYLFMLHHTLLEWAYWSLTSTSDSVQFISTQQQQHLLHALMFDLDIATLDL